MIYFRLSSTINVYILIVLNIINILLNIIVLYAILHLNGSYLRIINIIVLYIFGNDSIIKIKHLYFCKHFIHYYKSIYIYIIKYIL